MAISEADADAMRNGGMAHLLSISGLQVTAVVGAIFLLVSRFIALIPGLALRITVPLIAATVAALGGWLYVIDWCRSANRPVLHCCAVNIGRIGVRT